MTASAEWHHDRLAIARASAGTVILVAAFVAYAIWAFLFLTDPATSWVHVESANGDAVVHSILTQAWSSRWGEILKGVATDANSSRFRPISHLVEHYDAYLRHDIVARIGFIPAFANFSSLVYFTVCPVLAFLIARQILGISAVGAALIALAIVALLTSTGYNSASIFIFRPAKKILIFVTLAQMLVAVWYMHAPRLRLVFALGALQFVAAMTDEIGLFSGILIPVLIVLVVTARARHLAVLAAFWLLTALGFLYGDLLRSTPNFVAPPMSDALAAMLSSEFYTSIAAHLAGSLSILYGPAIGKALWVAGIVLATTAALRAVWRRPDDRAAALTLIAAVLLLANAAVAALILTYGGSAYMSEHGYYYGSVLAVFGFFLTCAALGSGGVITRSLIAAALIVSIGSNLIQMPRMNHLIAVMHNNPYPVEAINRAGTLALAGAVSMPVCSPAVIGAALDRDFATLGIDRSALYAHSPFPPAPIITDRFLPSVFGMMLLNPPRIEIESEKNGAC